MSCLVCTFSRGACHIPCLTRTVKSHMYKVVCFMSSASVALHLCCMVSATSSCTNIDYITRLIINLQQTTLHALPLVSHAVQPPDPAFGALSALAVLPECGRHAQASRPSEHRGFPQCCYVVSSPFCSQPTSPCIMYMSANIAIHVQSWMQHLSLEIA